MQDARDLSTRSAADVWDMFVGEQSAAEFIEYDGDVDDYVQNHPLCTDLDAPERLIVARKLREYLNAYLAKAAARP